MKVKLDFSLYKGTTRLKVWWKEVKAHFTQLQEAHNALDTALSDEVTARTDGDRDLQKRLDTHTASRGSSTVYGHVKLSDGENQTFNAGMGVAATPLAVKTAYDKAVEGVNAAASTQTNLNTEISNRRTADTTLQLNIDTETANRKSGDSALDKKISDEATARKSADNALDGRVTAVENKAHTHANKTVLDGISAADIENWNGILEQVTQTQLEDVKAYLEEMCFSFTDEFQRVYAAIGVTVYDGGIFGMEQTDIALDGGGFDAEPDGTVDCGGFEPITVGAAAVTDGGTF